MNYKILRYLRKISYIGFLISQLSFAQTNYFNQGIPKGKVLVVAHRGDWRNYPENSIKAIEGAIKLGVDIVEIDLQKTKDGQLIVMHDNQLDRTTTGKGSVSEKSFAEIQPLFLKDGLGIATKEKVPTLEEVLHFIKGKRVMINLDKAWDFIEEVRLLSDKIGTTQQIILKGNKKASELKKVLGSTLDHIIYMPIIRPEDFNNNNNGEALNSLEYINDFSNIFNPVAYEVVIKEDAPKLDELLKQISDAHAMIWINTLWSDLCAGHNDDKAIDNPEENWGWIIRKGARIIQTDRPEALIQYLKLKKMKYEN